jgi:tRNA U54 and U55 pseudouridine synthase Pus10
MKRHPKRIKKRRAKMYEKRRVLNIKEHLGKWFNFLIDQRIIADIVAAHNKRKCLDSVILY